MLLVPGAVNHGLQFLLRGYDHPCFTMRELTQILNAGLEVQHQLRTVTDELPDLVHQKDDARVVLLAVGVDDFSEVLGGIREVTNLILNKNLGAFLGHFSHGNEGFDHGIAVEESLCAGLGPIPTRNLLKRLSEFFQLTFLVQRAFQISYPRAGTAVTDSLVKGANHNIHDSLRL